MITAYKAERDNDMIESNLEAKNCNHGQLFLAYV